jgi:aspartate kinase
VVVVSAMSGETNRLIALAKDVSPQPDARELDVMISTGEQVTIALLAMALKDIGLKARSYTGGQVKVLTDSTLPKRASWQIDEPTSGATWTTAPWSSSPASRVWMRTATSPPSAAAARIPPAVALAAALTADECQIYTDVDGVYTTDPRIVPEARKLDRVTFEEMLEMASLGSKVLQIRSVEFAGKYKVKLRVLSSLRGRGQETSGTLITFEEDKNMEQPIISGIAFNRDEAKLTVLGVPDRPGIAYQILGPIADANIDVDMIIQNVGHDGTTDFSFTVNRGDFARTKKLLEEQIKPHIGARAIEGDNKICKVSAVGVGMRSHPGVASKMFRTLAEEGINIQMISTSEIKISVVVDEKYLELAVRVLHRVFELDQLPA